MEDPNKDIALDDSDNEEELDPCADDKTDAAVPDEQGKPALSYIALITRAIESSPNQMATLGEICNYICETYPYYKARYPSWQNSIRHNLSLNDCFVKVARTPSTPGKGNFWKLDPLAANMFDNGSLLRRRKRYKRPTTHYLAAPYLHALNILHGHPSYPAGSPAMIPAAFRHSHLHHFHPYSVPRLHSLHAFQNPFSPPVMPPYRPLPDSSGVHIFDSHMAALNYSAMAARMPVQQNLPPAMPPQHPDAVADLQRPVARRSPSPTFASSAVKRKSISPFERSSPSPKRSLSVPDHCGTEASEPEMKKSTFISASSFSIDSILSRPSKRISRSCSPPSSESPSISPRLPQTSPPPLSAI
ncbi:Fork head domain, partial [Trinorchestia longiramus]